MGLQQTSQSPHQSPKVMDGSNHRDFPSKKGTLKKAVRTCP